MRLARLASFSFLYTTFSVTVPKNILGAPFGRPFERQEALEPVEKIVYFVLKLTQFEGRERVLRDKNVTLTIRNCYKLVKARTKNRSVCG